MLENQRELQAIVTSQTKLKADKVTQRLSLFNPDGSPYGSEDSVANLLDPIQLVRSNGTITTSNTGGNFIDLDPSGSVLARDLDLVWDNVEVGDRLGISMSGLWGNEAATVNVDAATIDDEGDHVNYWSGGHPGGVTGWAALIAYTLVGPLSWYTVQEGDILDGVVRARLVYKTTSTTKRLFATAGYQDFRVSQYGPFR